MASIRDEALACELRIRDDATAQKLLSVATMFYRGIRREELCLRAGHAKP